MSIEQINSYITKQPIIVSIIITSNRINIDIDIKISNSLTFIQIIRLALLVIIVIVIALIECQRLLFINEH